MERVLLVTKISTLIALVALLISLVFLVNSFNSSVGTFTAKADKLLTTTDKAVEENSKQLKNAILSWHGISFDIRKNYTKNTDIMTDAQTKTLETVTRFLDTLASPVKVLVPKLSKVADNVDLLVTDIRQQLGVLSNELLGCVAEIRRGVALVVNGELVGLIKTVSSDFDGIAQELKCAISTLSSNASVVLSQIGAVTENVEDATFYVARITGDAAEVSNYYKMKLMHPSKWDIFKRILNIAVFGLGEIAIPLWNVQRVRVVT